MFGFGQAITNGSFENWDTTSVTPTSTQIDTVYNIENAIWGLANSWESGTPQGFGYARTTDSYDGDYALILHNWYGLANESASYNQSINYNPVYFTGFYKYRGESYSDTIINGPIIEILLYTNNQQNVSLTTVRLDTISEYTKFEIELNYQNSLIADSVYIKFLNSDRHCTGTDALCNFLYLDNLQFSNTTTIEEIQNSNKTLLKITDILGRETKESSNNPLFYIYDDGTVEKKIIIE